MTEKFGRARRLKKPNQLPSLYFCLLVYTLAEQETEQFLTRLNMPARLSRAIRDTLRLRLILPLLDKPSLKPSQIYSLLREYEPLAIQVNALASNSATTQHHLQLFLTELRYVRALLDGEDLKKLGVSAGPDMGRILQVLHKAKLDGEVRTRADEKKLVLSLSLGSER